ncbi:11502_t:CDS:2 [Entrophospora sp. SA101]|nr:14546_t:CDS:2 [Entrophospora sp. SA101]CAJ0757130.1 11502_t:CDS:2 [Entrophospora sp. SA101]CAJ0826065.1 399_t:CDS:2 [Entrophospora sp. SA101]
MEFKINLEPIMLGISSAPSRIVNVSSMAHKHAPKGEIEFDKINDPDAQAPNSTL